MSLRIHGPTTPSSASVLSDAAKGFLSDLVVQFGPRVRERLGAREVQQRAFDQGARPDFLAATKSVRAGDWKVGAMPTDLHDRRVEITGPVDRKMIINALNSGANVFMADFEDSNAPTFENIIEGQQNLYDAVRRTISHVDPVKEKSYRLNDRVATLMVRPRGWHLLEKHAKVDGVHVPAALFDFGLYFFHNARELVERGSGPYFYLPKLQSHLEARLWNDVFDWSEDRLELPRGTIKATVLIETLPAAFEMDEILYELREHSAGLNCGRWDYIFSYIKTLRNDSAFVIPDRGEVGMEQPFMRAYTQLLVKTCHRRGAFAMGGMAAQIPIKDNAAANELALEKVKKDKLREVRDGHDGTWVAHPGLVSLAREIFDREMPGANQIDRRRDDVHVTAKEMLAVPTGAKTETGLRHSIRVGVQYIEAWLGGEGCVPIYNLMEDAATAEISRTQIWQWVKHGVRLDDGTKVDRALVSRLLDEELVTLARELGAERVQAGRFAKARELFERVATQEPFEEFLTLSAYEHLLGA